MDEAVMAVWSAAAVAAAFHCAAESSTVALTILPR
jgi:hypothetical protein